MTVIAFDGKTLASDSRMTDDCGQTSVTKIWRLPNGALFGGAGSAGMSAPQALAHIIEHELADGVGGAVQELTLRPRRKKGIRKSS